MSKVYNNKYETIEELGVGAFSKVYKARVLQKGQKSVLEPKPDIAIEKDKQMTNENINTANAMIAEETKTSDVKTTSEFVGLKKLKNMIVKFEMSDFDK